MQPKLLEKINRCEEKVMKGQRNELMEEEYLCPKDEKAMKRYANGGILKYQECKG